MHTPILIPLFVATTLLAGARSPAQQQPFGPAGFGFDRVHGLVRDEVGAPWAIGRDYKARLADGRVEFTPALGKGVPDNVPLTFALLSIERGGTTVHEGNSAPPAAVEGQVVTFSRGTILERYECRPEAVEQSFVFHERPVGSGDLVVRGAITTALQPTTAADGTLFFHDGRVGGVTIGGVTGIDANGARVAGSLRFGGGVLELRLPAAFVDHAAYPLVLDPLLGTGFLAGSTFEDEDQVDTAFEEGLNLWLVAWRRTYSDHDQDIVAQRVTASGAFFGTAMSITLSTIAEGKPSVAAVNGRNRFVVAWQWSPTGFGPYGIRAASVSTASVAATVDVSQNGVSPLAVGDRSTSGTKALVAWNEGSAVKRRTADVSATGTIALGTVATTAVGTAVDMQLSRSRTPTSATLMVVHDLFVQHLVALDYDGLALFTTTVPHAWDGFKVDGNGASFVIAAESVASTGTCTQVVWNGAALTIGATTTFATTRPNSIALAWLGERFLVAWEAPTANPFDSELKAITVKPDCTTCSVEYAIAVVTRPNQRMPSIGACYAGGSGLPRALLVWSETNLTPPFRSLVHAQRFEAMTGAPAVQLSAACAGGGIASSDQPFALGSEDFNFVLSGGDPTAPFAVLGLSDGSTPPLLCGCALTNPLAAYAMLAINGTARQAFPVPCNPLLLGFTLEYQWLLVGGSSSPCPLVPGLTGSARHLLTLSL